MAKSYVAAALLALGLVASPAFAQGEKGWVDVNFGVAKAAEESFTATRVLTISQESGGGSVAYGVPKGGAFDVGGGYMFSSRIAASCSPAFIRPISAVSDVPARPANSSAVTTGPSSRTSVSVTSRPSASAEP